MKKKRKGIITIRLEILSSDLSEERFCEWSQNGVLHREDDHAAVIYNDCRFWYYNGEEIDNQFDDDFF
jgi:hypothetical protein